MRESYDFVIVGAGSSGCVLASRLSEDPRNSVLLIESGPEDRHPLIPMPLGVGKLFRIPSGRDYYSLYKVSPGGNRPPNYWMKGKTIGGSSSVNGSVYMRGLPSDYDRWEALGCAGWGWRTMGRAFRDIENHQLGAAEWRGAGGPLNVSVSRPGALGRAVIAAAGEAGVATAEDINDPSISPLGVFGPQPCTIWRGRRMSAAKAFLDPSRRRPNLDVVTETDVVGIAFDGLRASGVHIRGKAGVHTVNAGREIILSAGAIHSPKLLQLAGIGPAALLKAHGIDVRVDAPDVGRNLQDHRSMGTIFRLKHGGRNNELRGFRLALSALAYAFGRRGALTSCVWECGGLVRTMADLAEPDCQVGVSVFTHDEKGVPATPSMAIRGYVCRPESRGEIRIASSDPAAPPDIDANFLSHPYDREHLVSLFRFFRKLADQPALAAFAPTELMPGAHVATDDDIIEENFAQGTCSFHISGTCRMGDDARAVLTPDLRVRGVSGLRVVDTSAMPRLVSGNTNGPVMAFAWHAATRILHHD